MSHLSPKDEEPKGKIYQFFTKQDNTNTARAKWLAAVRPEYDTFWEVILSQTYPEDCPLNKAVLVLDMIPIVRFLNPQALMMIHQHEMFRDRLNHLMVIGLDNQHWATTRHKFYYE